MEENPRGSGVWSRLSKPARFGVGAGVLLTILFVIGSIGDDSSEVLREQSFSEETANGSEDLSSTEAPTTTTATPPPSEPELPVISSGTYIVPEEFPPGQYRVSGYFARLDANMDIIANDGVYGEGELTFMEVLETDAYVEISGEAITVEAFREFAGNYDPIALGVETGTYIVGEGVAPGRYRVEGESYAYAARLKCNGDIISNTGNAGSVIIVVQESDCLFQFTGQLSRID